MTYWDNLKQTLTNLVDTYHRKKSIQELHSLTERCPIIQPDKAVIRAYKYRGHGQYKRISPYQNPSELIELTKIVRDKQPKTVVEIGTDQGGTLYIWTQALPTANQFISIDLPCGDFGGGYSEGRAQFYNSFTDKDLTCIRQNSHHQETKQQLKENLQGHSIDFLFIDADHTYEGVKQDHKMYKDLVSDNGIIAFHDIVPNDTAPAIGVDTYWEELEENHTTKEIIADPDQGGGGIGIIEHKNQKQ